MGYGANFFISYVVESSFNLTAYPLGTIHFLRGIEVGNTSSNEKVPTGGTTFAAKKHGKLTMFLNRAHN